MGPEVAWLRDKSTQASGGDAWLKYRRPSAVQSMRRACDHAATMHGNGPGGAGTADRPAAQSMLRRAVQNGNRGVGSDDISEGLEPDPIPVDRNVEGQALLRFRQTLHRVRYPSPVLKREADPTDGADLARSM